jgi:2-dehydro-3-deoxygluconokinase
MGQDLVGLGEVMLRLAAPPPLRLEQAVSLDVQIGGAEANVMAACARLGLSTAFISALPTDHVWADRTFVSWRVTASTVAASRPAAHEWASISSVGLRPGPSALYDRRESALSRLTPDQPDWTLVREARLVHLSGVTAALGTICACGGAARHRRAAAGVPVSFDVNYRSRLLGT